MLTKEEIIAMKFDAYIKGGLKNELKYISRSKKNQSKRRVLFSEMTQKERQKLISEYCMEDVYFPNIITEFIEAEKLDAIIQNELLFEALKALKPKARKIILCKFWLEMSDKDIGQVMELSRQLVTYHRNKALQNLKETIEEMMKNDSWD